MESRQQTNETQGLGTTEDEGCIKDMKETVRQDGQDIGSWRSTGYGRNRFHSTGENDFFRKSLLENPVILSKTL